MPVSSPSQASAAPPRRPSNQRAARSVRFEMPTPARARVSAQRATVTPQDADVFECSATSDIRSRYRFGPRSGRLTRRERQRLEVPPQLRHAFAQGTTLDVETEAFDDGSVEVVDCEWLASRKELQRWRLNLTDFHALLTGGTETVEAYRSEQRRKDRLLQDGEQALQAQQEAAAIDEVAQAELLARTGRALPKPLAQAPDANSAEPEPTWRRVLAWPWRAIKRLWQWLVHKLG